MHHRFLLKAAALINYIIFTGWSKETVDVLHSNCVTAKSVGHAVVTTLII